MSQSLRGSTVTNYFKFSLAGTSTIVLYSFESPWASLCPCANTCCVRGVASARPRRASKRLDCRLWKRDLFHQHNRKGKIVMIETSRYKGLVFGFVFGTWNWYDFWRRSWGLPCSLVGEGDLVHHCDSGVPEASMLVRSVELYPYVQSAFEQKTQLVSWLSKTATGAMAWCTLTSSYATN